MDVELLQFHYSPYNEKARWALDLKRLPHRRRALMPGPHMGAVRRHTGQTATPAVRFDEHWVAGSANILQELERRVPEPPLFPVDAALRAEALRIERWFDEDIGPRTRRAVLATVIEHGGYVARLFGQDKGPIVRGLYTLIFPLARARIAAGNGLTGPEAVADGWQAMREAMAFVAERTAATGYLVGDRFGVADLTAASFLATAADPPGSPMERPKPRPASLQRWLDAWQDEPAVAWTRTIYARHRRPA